MYNVKVYKNLNEFTPLKNAIVTNGTFDGVHLGHQKILSRLIESAKSSNGESVVLTFWPHPRVVLQPERTDLKLLSTLDEKIEQMENLGVDHLLIIPFTKEFANTSSSDYINIILKEKIGTKHLIIGYDHKFGKGREGSFEYLSKHAPSLGIQVEEIPMQDIDKIGISSTLIRKALATGDIDTANNNLGRPYSISGKVVSGDKLGRKIGFPTANIKINESLKLIPTNGVYAVNVIINHKKYNGMLNIGTRPTVDGKHASIEVNIFDFDEDIYGREVKVSFVQKIRSENKFPDLEELKQQLIKDKEFATNILR